MKILLLLVIFGTTSHSSALSCLRCPEQPVCAPLRGCEKATQPCGCCPVCALGYGARCGLLTQRCRSGLKCAREIDGVVEVATTPYWQPPYKGRCTDSTTESTACDYSTVDKIKECVFRSNLFKPNMIPKSDDEVASYCSANATINCVATQMEECVLDDRQTKLLKQLVSFDSVVMGQEKFCNNSNGQSECYTNLRVDSVQNCMADAEGNIINAGEPANIKSELDGMCRFFKSYAKCLPTSCSVFKRAVEGTRYKYCSLSEAMKYKVVTEYEGGVNSATFLTPSLMSILTVIVAEIGM